MIVRQYAPCSLGRSIICLGKQGEINALRVEFDVSAWMAMYPDATVKLMHFAPDRPQDNPVIPTLGVEGTLRVWIVGEKDTANSGNGVIELLLIDERTGSTIKSATGYTTVLRSPSAGIEAQEAEAGYVRYDVDQSALLTDEQKAMARKNIGAGTGDETGSGGILKETDPTVPDWAKQPSKPTYTASEVGARPDTWTPSASDVGADAAGTASGAVAAHNTSGAAHADLRALIEGLTSRLNALADSDDTTLDQLSEIVAYIKSNKTLIDAVTTGKVSTSDIVDNLTTNASGKVLSAAQGVALKAMIDGIVIPTALPNPQPITINGQRYDGSEAVEVSVSAGGGSTVELDTTLTQSGKAADAKVVGDKLSALNGANALQDTEIAKKANNADLAVVAKSGSYNDLSNKPTIPTVPSTLPNPNALTFTGAVNETYDGSAAKSVSIPTIPESLKNPNKLILSGAVTAEYDGSAPVSVEIPAGGPGSYTLPIASATQLGGVMPAAKTDEMTQAVGVDEAGGLWTSAGSGDGEWTKVVEVQTTEDLNYLSITEDMNGNPLSFDEAIVLFVTARQKDATSNGAFVMSVSPQWVNSFNSRGIYSLPLNNDAYSFAGHFKKMGDFILQNCILKKRVAGSIDAVTSLTYALDGAGCNGTNVGDVQCATIRTSSYGNTNYFNSEGKMYGITIGTDMSTNIMIAKGSRLGVWVR